MEYTANAKMMLGYIDDDEDEILDYDGNLDLSTDNDEDEEAESVGLQEYHQQPYPETPEQKINWQEQIRMIHLRSHLNQLLEKVKHAQYITDKTREELKKCRGQIQNYEGERDSLFAEIQNKESEGNQSAVHRVRAAHERICKELEAEQKLEKMIIERLDQAEYDLALAEVERGKFILAEDDLLQREHQLSKEKTDMAMVRLHKEEHLARQALITKRKDERAQRNAQLDAERRHMQAVEEAERSHERANKYLQKTLAKLNQRQQQEAERYKTDMSKKMDMLLKLRNAITHNRENLRAIRARDKAAERKEMAAEQEERREISAQGGNPEEILLMKKRRNEMEKNKQQFEAQQKVKKSEIMQKILLEEKNIKKRKKLQPYLFDDPEKEKSLRVGPHPLKPLQALEDYMQSTEDSMDLPDEDKDVDTKEKEILEVLPKQKMHKSSLKPLPLDDSEQQEESEEVNKPPSIKESSSDSYMGMSLYKRLLRKLSANMQGKKYVSQTTIPVVPAQKGDPSSVKNKNKNQTEGVEDETKMEQEVEAEAGYGENEEGEDKLDLAEEENDGLAEDVEAIEAAMEISIPSGDQDKIMDSSDEDEEEADAVDLAKPEFEGLWARETKPYHIPKDIDIMANKPVGGSKMDKEILQKTLEKTREGIVVTQVAAGREFTGCPFYSKPDVIHFKDFVVGKTYKKKVTLTNVSYTVNYIKFLQITERLKDFIKIHFDPPGQMSAGLTCEMIVTFKPMINEDLKGEVNFLTQTGPFNIPLICSTKKCDLVLDTGSVDFGTTVIGETMKRTFTLTNRGALGTKFDFFKVTGMKPRTLTTAGTSLGRLTTDSMRAVSPDSTGAADKNKGTTGSSFAVDSKKKSEEALDKIPEATETTATTEGGGDGSEGTEGNQADLGTDGSEQKEERDTDGATSPDLAVSEMDDYSSLDGMRVGPLVTGEIGPFSSLRLEIIWQPTIPGRVDSEFMVSFTDPLSEPLSIRALANAIDVPVWVERSTVDLKICMFDRLYQDTIIVNNRATSALKLKFEVCKELKNHLELLPKTGYIQAQSQFSAQLKFLPRQTLYQEASKFFDPETGVFEAPLTIRVADQTTPVNFTVQAVVTTSDLEFDVSDINFGHCTVHESVKKSIKLTNHSILPQEFGFVGLPGYVEVQPNDGFGTLLPLETIDLDVIFSPTKAREYKLDLVCRSLINRDFRIQCQGVGVLTPLELSQQVVHFSATPLYDISTAAFHVINSHTSSNEFTHPVPRIGKGEICPVGPTSFEFQVPPDAPITISPSVGTLMPGEKRRIQVRFAPTLSDYDIRQEALRIYTKQEAAREEKEREEAALREKMEKEQKEAAAGGKGKGKDKNSPKTGAPQGKTSKLSAAPSSTGSAITQEASPRFDPDKLSRDSPEYQAAVTSLVRQFKGRFESLTIPCCVASGATANPGDLEYSIHNTLYLNVHCPAIKPPIVVISEGGRRTVDFGDVSIGQTCPKSVTIQNISDKDVELHGTALNPGGPFLMLNALRALSPGGTHTVLFTFAPAQGQMFQETFCISTQHNTLHLTLKGRGVSPLVNLTVEDNLFNMNAVLVSEYVEKIFKIQNTSTLAIDYVIKQDSLSPLRYQNQQDIPPFVENIGQKKNYVGTQNENGRNVFDIVPTTGTIEAGESKEIMVTFAPDHESDLYSDGVRIELFDQGCLHYDKEESHFFQVIGQAKQRVMFLDGVDPLAPTLESLAQEVAHIEEEDPEGKSAIVISAPALVTVRSVMKDDVFQPAVREIYAGCVRTMAVSQKKPGKTNGEFSVEGIQGLLQKGFTIEPQKGMVEAGTKKPIVITWQPPNGYDPSKTVEEVITLTLKCDVAEQIPLMIRAMVVTE